MRIPISRCRQVDVCALLAPRPNGRPAMRTARNRQIGLGSLCLSLLALLVLSCSTESEIELGGSSASVPIEMMTTRYPDNGDLVWKRFQVKGFNGLTRQEQVVHCVWWLEAEVNNGGFHQFFSNSAGDLTEQTLEALDAIGAQKTKLLLQRAIGTAFGETAPPSIRKDRNRLLDRDTEAEEGRLFDELSELDTAFYKYEDSLEDLVNTWLATGE